MKKKLSVPNDLSEITLGQYQKFHRIQEQNDDPYFIQCKMIEIFCNLDALAVRKMKMSDAERVAKIINDMFEKKPPLMHSFYLNSKEFGFIPDLNNISFGEYIDLDTHISNWENMHLAMNVLYRPIKQKIKDKYLIEEYDLDRKDALLEMPMSAVMGSIFFLFRLGRDLSKIMASYLEKESKGDLTAFLSFQENMDGFNQYMHSLKGVLKDLKISLS
tara:strand:- start:120 stop:770 length:651 start_codon:yes stop_codon:yes gene_type:complete